MTGLFLDDLSDAAATKARRDALLSSSVAAGWRPRRPTRIRHRRSASARSLRGDGRRQRALARLQPPDQRHFKWHWSYPTQIAVKVEDPDNPINAPSVNQGTGARTDRPFNIVDEVYTFNETSWSRANAHVLTSIDYTKMPAEVKAQEPAPKRSDGDYALSYIRREGNGRVFVEVLGHDESIYKLTPMLAHILAGSVRARDLQITTREQVTSAVH
jgi:hypothetical protein